MNTEAIRFITETVMPIKPEAGRIIMLAMGNPGVGIVPSEEADDHELLDDQQFQAELRARGVDLAHFPGEQGDEVRSRALYRKAYGMEMGVARTCLVLATAA